MLVIPKIIMYGLAGYFSFYSLYWFVSTLLGVSYRPQKPKSSNHSSPNILLILPAYKPGNIFHMVASCIVQAIHRRNIRVYVLLQEAKPEYRIAMEKHGFWVEEATFSHLPGNSYHHALKHIVKQINSYEEQNKWRPDFVMLVDKDNLLAEDFFGNITPTEYAQYDVIQGRRCSINANGKVSFFDTVSERLNDTMFRAAKSLFKSTIEVSGSGALIRTELFKDAINRLDPKAPGYDKNFMVQILTQSQKVRTLFLPYVILFEEKTAEMDSFNPQRVRWFGEQYYNATYSAGKLVKAFIQFGRLSALEYLIALWRPPRSVQILLVPTLGLLETAAYLWKGYWWLHFPFFTVSTFILVMAAMSFLAKEKILTEALRHIFGLPRLAFSNAKNAASSMKKENHGKFIHTQHKM